MNTEFPRPTTTGARRAAAAYRTCSGCSTRSCPRGSCIGTCSSLSSLPLFWSLFYPLSPSILICSLHRLRPGGEPQSWMWPKFIKNPGAGGRVTSTHGFQREANESIGEYWHQNSSNLNSSKGAFARYNIKTQSNAATRWRRKRR